MKQNKKPYIIGLTGNSGSGKGAVGRIMADSKKYGCFIIDCDVVAHENMKCGGLAYNDIVDSFGRDILDENGGIDRKKLGGIVFSDKEKLKLLNSITHGYVKQRVDEIIKANMQYDFIVVDAPLLKEAGMLDTVDTIWLVKASEYTRLKRVIRRDNITAEAAKARFKNQKPFDEDLADTIIQNDSENKEELVPVVETALDALYNSRFLQGDHNV